ncbi:MAG TPA: hypothetical protein VKU01_24105 [Bryobacteraceae bacterium]|nr:hypothetical protein [Bryobacteraceae bacterium]
MTNNDWVDPTQESAQTESAEPDKSAQLKKKIIIVFTAVAVLTLSLAGSYLVARVGQASPAPKMVAKTVVQPAPQPHPAVSDAKPSPIKPAETPAGEKPASTKDVALVAKAVPPPPESKVAATVKPVVVPELPPPAKTSPSAAPAKSSGDASVITPHSGEKYLQVGALATRMVPDYVKELQAKGLHPIVAPGPDESHDLRRILLGPFPDRNALKQASLDLEAQGIVSFPQVY